MLAWKQPFIQRVRNSSLVERPCDLLFLETDDDPVPIEDIYDEAASVRHTEVAALRETILNNYNRIFESK